MKLKNPVPMLCIPVLATIISTHAFAKDIGVCVQIIEHVESETTAEKPADRSAEKSKLPPRPSAGTVDTNITQESTSEAATLESPPPAPKDRMAGPPQPKAPMTAPAPLPPSVTQQADQTADQQADNDQKELAALRSKYELSKVDASWDADTGILPYGQTALVYLKRLFEHFVTHEPGFASTAEKCEQTITVELYPLKQGWTAFARYSGTNREERVDQLFATELSQFAERSVLALLHDVPISATIKRDNVLSSDSKQQVQQVKGSSHFTLNIGTRMVGAMVDQVQTDGDDAGNVSEQFRIYHPMKLGLGYRGRFENWGLEVQTGVGIGVGKKAASSNPTGGHIDYGGDAGLAIHFLNYRDPRGLVSFYMGGGAGFDFMWFNVINRENASSLRSFLYSGGLSADGVFGWEFLRAASVQFFIQGELNLPLYITRSENNDGKIGSWMPGITFKLGIVF